MKFFDNYQKKMIKRENTTNYLSGNIFPGLEAKGPTKDYFKYFGVQKQKLMN
jgi:hypothetical protein